MHLVPWVFPELNKETICLVVYLLVKCFLFNVYIHINTAPLLT